MRADAKQNYDHLLASARTVISEHGANASLRDIARRAEVGLATLYRHFPTREALLEALLSEGLDKLRRKADEVEIAHSPDEALICWLRDAVVFAHSYKGVVTLMANAIEDPDSALHISCTTVRSAGARLLRQAQAEGMARTDVDGTDLFALIGALAWLSDQPSLAPRADHLFDLITGTILNNP